MRGGPIVVPILSYANLASRAEAFLNRYHPSREIPIPVEEIIDVDLQIEIMPIPGLSRIGSGDEDDMVEAFVNADLTAITVDEAAYEKQTNRYRFSLAHELGHIVLHRKVFSKLTFDSIEQWKQAMRTISQKDYQWLEWQAYAFAGLLLVPGEELAAEFEGCINLVRKQHMDPRDEAVPLHVEKYLGDVFSVSSAVIHKRIEKDQLWSRQWWVRSPLLRSPISRLARLCFR